MVAVMLPLSPAQAASLRKTVVSATAVPATVHVGAVLTISGSARPVRVGVAFSLQRLVGNTWKAVAHQKAGVAGTFAFHITAPKTPAVWVLRVSRAAGGGDKAGVSATRHVRVVKPIFAISAAAAKTAVLGRVVVSGKVGPRATGRVVVQELVGKVWKALATGVLAKTGTYSIALSLPVSSVNRLRVFKSFTTTTAQGRSKAFTVTVPPPNPALTLTSLPKAVIGRPYSTTLTATSGSAPYTWSASGLPVGFTLSAAGVLSGTSVVAGSFPLVVTVTDTGGRTGTEALTLTVAQTSVIGWGYNASGQLGDGNADTSFAAVPMQDLDSVKALAADSGYALALRTDGSVWAVGDNSIGQVGLATVLTASVPVPVPGLSSVVAVAAGEINGYALTSDGTVWASGPNDNGQLGDGTTTASRVFQPVPGLSHVVGISAGLEVAYALLADGTVWGWGKNGNGQLGQGTTSSQSATPVKVMGLTNVTAIASEGRTVIALLADGTLRTWGYNANGQLGDGTTTDSALPVQPIGIAGVAALATNMANDTSYAIRADGSLWAWGYNHYGQVGDGTRTDRLKPFQVPGLAGVTAVSPGRGNTFAVLSDGTLRGWGAGNNGDLGTGNETDQLSPVVVPGITGAVGASGGEATGYAVVAH
jgi:alpha-tubulin suppressor-like RCC1 family protein